MISKITAVLLKQEMPTECTHLEIEGVHVEITGTIKTARGLLQIIVLMFFCATSLCLWTMKLGHNRERSLSSWETLVTLFL